MRYSKRRGSLALRTGVALSGALAIAGLVACGQGAIDRGLTGQVPATSQELIEELQEQKERIDRTTDQMMERINAFNQKQGPQGRKVQFSELFYTDLSPEQRDILDELLETEESPSYRLLLTRIGEDRDSIQGLQEKVLHLEQRLPDKFVLVKQGDSHYNLAQSFLESQEVNEERSVELLKQIDLSEDLIPGFKVWYNYDPDQDSFRTYVTQGEAGHTPLAVKRAVKRKLVGERDVAIAQAAVLEERKTVLEEDIARLEVDVSGLENRREHLEGRVSDLVTRNSDLQSHVDRVEDDLEYKQNSVFYHANTRHALAEQGILTRFLKNLKDVQGITYDEALDFRQANSISFSPEEYGLTSIRDIELWPKGFQEGRDYTVQVSEEDGTATVVFEDPKVFKEKRVLLAIRGRT